VVWPALNEVRRPLLKRYRGNAARSRQSSQWRRVKAGHIVWLEAKRGKEKELADFLRAALPLARQETATVSCYAIRFGGSRCVIFAAFADEDDRRAHLAGRFFMVLEERCGELLAKPPTIERGEVLAAKLAEFR